MPAILRAGRCAILGATNVGKSTLINALVGQKIAIVSPTAQTTRRRILGAVQHGEVQVVLVDTPGLHRHKGALNHRLVQAATRTLQGVDAVLLVLDASRRSGPLDSEARKLLDRIAKQGLPCVVALNKIDKIKKPSLLPMLEELVKIHDFVAMVPISARDADGLEALIGELAALMPEGEALLDPEQFTDQTERDLTAELIREAALFRLHEELPHSVVVTIEQFDESRREEDGGLVAIDAVLWVERESQKAIAIGAGGAMVKNIGSAARKQLEPLLEAKVMLQLKVKVAEGWSDDPRALRRFGLAEE